VGELRFRIIGIERFARSNCAVVVVGASYRMFSWDSWVRRPLRLGVEGVEGVVAVGVLEMDD